jgi:hypothetical protein
MILRCMFKTLNLLFMLYILLYISVFFCFDMLPIQPGIMRVKVDLEQMRSEL